MNRQAQLQHIAELQHSLDELAERDLSGFEDELDEGTRQPSAP